jgi:hypothetical protein
MADHDRVLRLQRIQEADEIADQMEDGVLIDRLRLVALAVAAHVRGDHMEAGRGERIDLVTPGIPAFRKAVAQQHRRALALLDDIQADAVGLNDPLDRFAHGPHPINTLTAGYVLQRIFATHPLFRLFAP